MRTPTACCANTSPRAQTFPDTARTTSTPSPTNSTTGRENPRLGQTRRKNHRAVQHHAIRSIRGFCCFRGLDCGLWQSYVESAASEHDQGDEVVDVVEAVGHADGDLDPVVERLEARVRVSRPDRAQDAGAAPSDLLGESDDLGYARTGRPEHPAVQFRRGLADRVLERGAQEFLELPCAVELPLGVRVPQAFELFVFN